MLDQLIILAIMFNIMYHIGTLKIGNYYGLQYFVIIYFSLDKIHEIKH